MYRIGLIGNRAHQNTYGPIWHEREDCEIVAAAEHHEDKGKALSQLYGVEVAREYDAVSGRPKCRYRLHLHGFLSQAHANKKSTRLRQTRTGR